MQFKREKFKYSLSVSTALKLGPQWKKKLHLGYAYTIVSA